MLERDTPHLRRAFGSYPTGVTVVTARTEEGTPVGFTANSFTSVSLDPPLLLVCPGRQLSCFPVFDRCQDFAVSVLAEGQAEIATLFACYSGDRFAAAAWSSSARGLPLISGAAAHFSCRTHAKVEAGDHIVLIGAVESWAQSGAAGLAFADGRYAALTQAA